jgi:hypothetical protein
MSATVTESCYRCGRIIPEEELSACYTCGQPTCLRPVKEASEPCRCECYEIRLSQWPESREYYNLLDQANAGNSLPEILSQLDRWEGYFEQFGL